MLSSLVVGVSIYRRDDRAKNPWRADIRHNGRRASVSAPTRAEVVELAATRLIELGGTPAAMASSVTVDAVLESHIRRRRPRWSPQYARDLQRCAGRLPAEFTDRPAAELTGGDVAALYRRLRADGWSLHRRQRLRGLLSGAFRAAVIEGVMTTNPATLTAPDQPERADITVPTEAQVAAIVNAGRGQRDRTFLRVAALTGARRGELVALKWDDINDRRGEVVIRRALSVDDTGLTYHHPGKTGRRGHRVLSLDPHTVAMLVELHDLDAARSRVRRLPEPEWVFARAPGAEPWHPKTGTDVFNRARDAADITGIRLHDFRHYVATSMLQDGESLIDVANQLGDTVRTIERVYAHFLPGRGRDAALRRGRALG